MPAKPLTRMGELFPTTSHPLIISAPTLKVSNGRLAAEVTKAGGLGFIQAGFQLGPDAPELKRFDEQLTVARTLLVNDPATKDHLSPLPIGVGFLTYAKSAVHFPQSVVPILVKHQPAVVWLFAPNPAVPNTIPDMIASVRAASTAAWQPKIAVQVGNVAAAREAVKQGADIIVAQGSDAGGHLFAKGAGIVSLVPEIADMLRDEFADKDIILWAAGGMADGRGVAAALALGAEAAALGTRYCVAKESDAAEFRRKALLSTSDGGVNTIKSEVHDWIQGNMEWPAAYHGRALLHPLLLEYEAGVPIDEIQRRFNAATDAGDVFKLVTWSGTGVGLVKEELPAAQITKSLREEASKVIAGIKSNIVDDGFF
ncbi:FMN-dependent 2-nitropropane dioxygenase [Camillea tinctor]|nr:FMN-dependent 2-nitropropane dioxygenase [Camillea tinctor]